MFSFRYSFAPPNSKILPKNRFIFVISGKVCPSAVKRNLIKRRMRAIIREETPNLKSNVTGVFIMRREAITASFQDLKKSVAETIRHGRMVK